MKKQVLIIMFYSILFLSVLIILIPGCNKDDESTNQNPTCTITSPVSGNEFEIGETIIISVDATDNDGSISEVRFFIDNVGKGSATSFPYNYTWNTNNESSGNHTLKATSIDNGKASTSDEITITIIESSGNDPVAYFSANITNGTAPLTVNFTDQSTNNPTSWQWDFGDGSTSTQQNPSYSYTNVGTYTVSLYVSNDVSFDNETKVDFITVTSNGGIAPTAEFSANPSSGSAPLTVSFSDQSINNPNSWLWNFGDGTTSNQENPSHTYSSEGSYDITLTVNNDFGSDSEIKYGYITVDNSGGNTFTDPRDGKTYAVVQIGSQTWFAENLNYQTSNSSWYNNSSSNGTIYGRLYTWNAAKSACPSGWHLPSDDEWTSLADYLGGQDIAGNELKSTTGWNNNGNGTNSSGFSALPGGWYIDGQTFYHLGINGYWWSSSSIGGGATAWGRQIRSAESYVVPYGNDVLNKLSVRCVKD